MVRPATLISISHTVGLLISFVLEHNYAYDGMGGPAGVQAATRPSCR
jgi:hypothetical protein